MTLENPPTDQINHAGVGYENITNIAQLSYRASQSPVARMDQPEETFVEGGYESLVPTSSVNGIDTVQYTSLAENR